MRSILYVADSGNRSIRAVDLASGAVTTLPVNGAPGSMFARFNTPTGLARDGTHLYVSDSSDHVIVAVDLATKLVTAVAGTPRIAGVTDGIGAPRASTRRRASPPTDAAPSTSPTRSTTPSARSI